MINKHGFSALADSDRVLCLDSVPLFCPWRQQVSRCSLRKVGCGQRWFYPFQFLIFLPWRKGEAIDSSDSCDSSEIWESNLRCVFPVRWPTDIFHVFPRSFPLLATFQQQRGGSWRSQILVEVMSFRHLLWYVLILYGAVSDLLKISWTRPEIDPRIPPKPVCDWCRKGEGIWFSKINSCMANWDSSANAAAVPSSSRTTARVRKDSHDLRAPPNCWPRLLGKLSRLWSCQPGLRMGWDHMVSRTKSRAKQQDRKKRDIAIRRFWYQECPVCNG